MGNYVWLHAAYVMIVHLTDRGMGEHRTGK